MEFDTQPLRLFFHDLVDECYEARLGMHDAEISAYVTNLLTDFSRSDRLYRIRGAEGNALHEIGAMAEASDPVHGTAASFGEERELRKHIGDYALFLAGMYPDSARSASSLRGRDRGNSLMELVETGRESYYIVSQFDLFEFAAEAPFFARLAERFEDCMHGLNLVREQIDRARAALNRPAAGAGGSPADEIPNSNPEF